MTTITDETTWEALCEATNSLGADGVRKNGELVIDGDWLTESGITDVEQL
ncbi:hypothetical protein ACOHX9_000057 [Yersinia enterocolitica]|nr:hypothetical protein [Yersinia enterocolitica]